MLREPAGCTILGPFRRSIQVMAGILAAVALSGCARDQAKDIASCQVEADRFYQGYQANDVGNPRSKYIIACMDAKGYDFDFSPVECDSQHPMAIQPTCYVSKNLFQRISAWWQKS